MNFDHKKTPATLALIVASLLIVACSDSEPTGSTTGHEGQPIEAEALEHPAAKEPTEDVADPQPIPEDKLPVGLKRLVEPWFGDLADMQDRRVIRVLTTYGVGRYFLDGAQESGITYDLFKMFEDELNKKMKTGHLKVHVIYLPVARGNLIPFLLAGRGDIAAASLTITSERQEVVDFSQPVYSGVNEILVTGPSAPAIEAVDDLTGLTIHVRRSSSYRSSLEKLNRRFESEGKPLIDL